MPFAYLLQPAHIVKRHALHSHRIEEIGNGWVIEGNVSVLTDAYESQIQRSGCEEGGVPIQLGVQISGIAFQIMNNPRPYLFLETCSNPSSETRRMGCGKSDILIQMKSLDLAPWDVGHFN